MATLPSTQQVIGALREAYAARQRIRTNSPPVKFEELVLPDQRHWIPVGPDHEWYSIFCSEVVLRPDGQYMACVLHGTQSHVDLYDVATQDQRYIEFFDVSLYTTAQGFREIARFTTGNSGVAVKWSPAGHLCIAQSSCSLADADLSCKITLPPQLPGSAGDKGMAALVWDADLGTLVHSVGPHLAAELWQVPRDDWIYQEGPLWSPSCRFLVFQCVLTPMSFGNDAGDNLQHTGSLAVVDVAQGKVIAKSGVVRPRSASWEREIVIAWVPSSQAIILQSGRHVRDVEPFHRAGIAVGMLPNPSIFVGTAGFSPDTTFLDARAGNSRALQVLSCGISGMQVHLHHVHKFQTQPGEDLRSIGWLPDGLALCVQRYRSSNKRSELLLYKVIEKQLHVQSSVFGVQSTSLLSSSGLWITRSSQSLVGLDIYSTLSGDLCWRQQPSDPLHPGLLQDLMRRKDSSKWCKEHVTQHAWMPSGLGLICTPDRQCCDEDDEDFGMVPLEAPVLFLYWFA